MKNKCSEFIYALNNANINHYEDELVFRTIFIPRLNYQLKVSSLTQKQLSSLQEVYEPHVIAKLGFNRSWPKEYKYGTHQIGSLNLPNLFLDQTVSQLQIVIRFYQHEKHHTLINNVLETFLLQAGLHGDILAQPRQIHYTDSTWISNVINAMYHFNIKLIRPNPFIIQHQCKNDICIMKVVLQKNVKTSI